jgi:hypothetical protein
MGAQLLKHLVKTCDNNLPNQEMHVPLLLIFGSGVIKTTSTFF